MQARFLPDEPLASTTEDLLGLRDFVESVHSAIRNSSTPYVFGVFGDWGVGKTSSMRLLAATLEDELAKGVSFNVPIWINVWQFETEPNLLYPILQALRDDFHRRVPEENDARLLQAKFIKVVGSSLIAFADLGLRAVTKTLSGEAYKISDIKEQLAAVEGELGEMERLLSAWGAEVTRLPKLYADLIAAYANQLAMEFQVNADRFRFVFLIDDLDRCLPDSVIAVLERIKNFLNAPHCVYILGVNQQVVQQGIRHKFATIELDGREYLEKVINYSFYVPEPGREDVEKFASTKLGELLEPEEARRYHSHIRDFGRVLGECGFTNPRKIKRILNRYLAFLANHDIADQRWDTANIVRLLVMAEYFPDLFRVFRADSAGARKAILELSDGTSDFSKFEARYGVSLGLGRERIAGMRSLFDLRAPDAPSRYDIDQHIASVAKFRRLP